MVIAEDSVLLPACLTKLLESAGFEVQATAADAGELLAAVEPTAPKSLCHDRVSCGVTAWFAPSFPSSHT